MSASNYFPRWYYPISVTQFAEDDSHIAWQSNGNFVYIRGRDSFQTKTVAPLRHIPLSFSQSVRNTTWFLYCRFLLNQEPGTVTGLEVQLSIDRGGRVVDDTIQLYKNDEKIGENNASMDLSTLKKYGNTWGLDWDNPYILTSGDFGVLLRFQSNFTTPHNTVPSIDFVRMRYTIDGESLTNAQEARPNIGWTNAYVNSTNKDRDGTSSGDGGPGAGDGSGGDTSGGGSGFTGSIGFISSTGFSGSNGFTGSAFFPVSDARVVFINGSTVLVGNINSSNTVGTISLLPPSPTIIGEAYFVTSEGAVYYWTGSGWVRL